MKDLSIIKETMSSLQIAEVTGKGQVYFINKFKSKAKEGKL